VVTGKLLGGRGSHLFSADNAYVVCGGEFVCSGVWIECVHVVDCTTGQNNVVEGLLEGAHGEVHGTHREQRKCVNANHDNEKENVKKNPDQGYD